MLVGVVAETAAGDGRVSVTPAVVARLIDLGHDVVVEAGAGVGAGFADETYRTAGAAIAPHDQVWASSMVVGINPPPPQDTALLAAHATLICLLNPYGAPDLVESLTRDGLTVLALDAIPRLSRAQSMDVLSSMANIAGYRAVIEAAHAFGRLLGGQITAAGKVPPATVLVAGAGVAGLAAIRTAAGLGAVVRATDPRPEVAEQVASVGGQYLAVAAEVDHSTDGYARATSADYDRRAAELYSAQAAQVDIVITTALIPGRPAPQLFTAADVASMKPGTVVVDLAAARGGNVAGTVADEVVVTSNGVTIIGDTDLAARLPAQASTLYAGNLLSLITLLTPGKDGVLVIDDDDPVQRGITVVKDGELTWPPPPVQVSAAPAAVATPVAVAEPAPARPGRRRLLLAVGLAVLLALTALAPDPIPRHLTVFVLAVIIGYYVIGKVHHALHTPLMSVTNAISGIIVVGAMLQVTSAEPVVRVLAAVAIALASINIFGGFAVTRRMLGMFSKDRP